MYCDSAWLFSDENRLRAFENVRINQGDTLFLSGDYLQYNGNTRLAMVTGEEVILRDPDMTLTTTRLDINRNKHLAYYLQFGEIIDGENTLTSFQGFYETQSKIFHFKDSVVLVNPEYRIESDTLDYNSHTKVSYFRGPSTITSDSSFIYCENGRYNTLSDIAQFNENALIYEDNRFLTGDSIYFEQNRNYGEAWGNVLIHDTVENYLISGQYGEYHGYRDSLFVTQEPLYTLVDEEKDSLFLHADTLISVKRFDSLASEYDLLRAFYKVKFYKSNLQGKCDSLSYASLDSTFKMYNNPILWDDSTQITGDTIYLEMRNDEPDSLKVFPDAFMLSLVDSTKENQVSGIRILGKFKNSELSRVLVSGNGQTIYYPQEEDGDFIGMNRSLCSNILIHLKENEIKRIIFLKKPEGKLYPLENLSGELKFLPGYLNRFEERPDEKRDLFWD